MDWTSALSVGSATAAALLAAANLYVSGRRDEQRWLREQLMESFDVYLKASFQRTSAVRNLSKLPPDAASERQALLQDIAESDDLQMNTFTHLRLLTNRQVIKAAGALHAADHEYVELHKDGLPSDELHLAAKLECHRRREFFLQVSRRSLGIRGAVATVEDHV